jgi:excisionase family DNA binding protein
LSAWYIYELLMQGKIPCHRVGRRVLFDTHEIDVWMHER